MLRKRLRYAGWWIVDRATHLTFRIPTFCRTQVNEDGSMGWRHWKFYGTGVVWTIKPCCKVEGLWEELHPDGD